MKWASPQMNSCVTFRNLIPDGRGDEESLRGASRRASESDPRLAGSLQSSSGRRIREGTCSDLEEGTAMAVRANDGGWGVAGGEEGRSRGSALQNVWGPARLQVTGFKLDIRERVKDDLGVFISVTKRIDSGATENGLEERAG